MTITLPVWFLWTLAAMFGIPIVIFAIVLLVIGISIGLCRWRY